MYRSPSPLQSHKSGGEKFVHCWEKVGSRLCSLCQAEQAQKSTKSAKVKEGVRVTEKRTGGYERHVRNLKIDSFSKEDKESKSYVKVVAGMKSKRV